MSRTKFTPLTEELYSYLERHCSALSVEETGLIAATEALGEDARMQVASDQARLLTMLVRISGAHSAIEIGTFTGLSALAIARGLPRTGRLLCCDLRDDWIDIGRPFWAQAGIADRIDVRIAPALDTLLSFPEGPHFDFAFIDADKAIYPDYFEALIPRMTSGALLVTDNVLWGGAVTDRTDSSASTQGIRAFNRRAAADPRVETVILPVSDGISLARKR